jgi:predicted glycoside hydrolase/deacetylase ChbG (UPF0249 family)
MTIRLIVTGDDAGLSRGIDRSALQLHARGMISSVSVMANFPRLQDAIRLYQEFPELEIGLHLNLSDGKPLTAAAARSELTNGNGIFRNRLFLFALSMFPSAELLAVMRGELTAQIERMLEAGVQPAHLTTHCHFHVFPAVRDLVYELATAYHVRWVRNPDVRASLVPYNPMLDDDHANVVQDHAFFLPDYIVSLQHWLDHPPAQLLVDLLRLEGCVEMVVHPSVQIDETYPVDVAYLPEDRHRESRYLEQFFRVLEPHLGQEVEIVNSQARHAG